MGFASLHKEKLINDGGFQFGEKQLWTLDGKLQAGSPAAIDAALLGLVGAYSKDFQDAAFYFDDGTRTNLWMPGVAKLGGVRVKSLELPDGKGAVYSTYLPYRIVLEGMFELTGGDLLKSWKESLTFTGGGKRFSFLEPITGKPQKQQTKENVTYKVTQKGDAVGVYGYPVPPAPLWPEAEHREQRQIELTTPSVSWNLGKAAYYDYPISWSYSFEDADPLVATRPTLWSGRQ